jgi:hypothetical protein
LFEEDNEAGKLDKAKEIVGVVLPANEDPARDPWPACGLGQLRPVGLGAGGSRQFAIARKGELNSNGNAAPTGTR